MARAAQLLVDVDARTARMEAGMQRTNRELARLRTSSRDSSRSLRNMEQGMDRAGAGARKFASALGSVVALAAGGAGLNALVGQSFRAADAMAKTADVVALTTDELQELRFAADQAGVGAKQLDVGIQRFSRRLGEAIQGGGGLKKVLDELGISVRNADGSIRSTREVLGEYADAVKNAGSGQEQLRLAFAGFDSEGARLVNVLRDGSAGLDAYAARARELGVVVDQDLIRSAELAVSRFDALRNAMGSRLQAVVLESVDTIHTLIDVLETDVGTDVLSAWAAPFRQAVADAIGYAEQLRPVLEEVLGPAGPLTARQAAVELPANLKAATQLAAVEVAAFVGRAAAHMDSLDAGIILVTDSIKLWFRGAFAAALSYVEGFVADSARELSGFAKAATAAFDGTPLERFTGKLQSAARILDGIADTQVHRQRERMASIAAEQEATLGAYLDAAAAADAAIATSDAARDASIESILEERDATLAATAATVDKAKADLAAAEASRARFLATNKAAREDLLTGGPPALDGGTTAGTKSTRTRKPAKTDAEREAVREAAAAKRDAKRLEAEALSLIKSLRTPHEAYEAQLARIAHLHRELPKTFDGTQVARAQAEALRTLEDQTRGHLLTMEDLAQETAHALEHAFADFLFDPFEGGLKGMVDSFTQTLRRMAADAAAAAIVDNLFKSGGGAGGGGGFGGLLAGIAGAFFPGAALGRPVTAGTPHIVGEIGRELFIPKADGQIVPNSQAAQAVNRSSTSVTNNITINTGGAPVDKRAQSQILSAVGSATNRALQRNS